MSNLRDAAWPDEPVADLSDGLEPELSARLLLRDSTETRDHAVDRIFADDPAFPAENSKIVLADHGATGTVKRHQKLHDPGLDDRCLAGEDDFAGRRPELGLPDPEGRLARKHDPLRFIVPNEP